MVRIGEMTSYIQILCTEGLNITRKSQNLSKSKFSEISFLGLPYL